MTKGNTKKNLPGKRITKMALLLIETSPREDKQYFRAIANGLIPLHPARHVLLPWEDVQPMNLEINNDICLAETVRGESEIFSRGGSSKRQNWDEACNAAVDNLWP